MGSLFPSDKSIGGRYADVILPLNLPQALTYGIPHEMQGLLQPGMRVEVSLRQNKTYSGIVERIHNEKPEAYSVKPVKSIMDEEPVVNERQLQFWRWIAHYYMATPGEVMQAALPAHLKLAGETRIQWAPQHEDVVYEWSSHTQIAVDVLEQRKELGITELRSLVGGRHFIEVLNELLENEAVVINDSLEHSYKPKKERVISLQAAYREETAMIQLFDKLSKAPKQLELLMAWIELSRKETIVRQQDLLDRTGASAAQIKALSDKGIFRTEEIAVDRINFTRTEEIKEIVFTPAQQEAYNLLEAGLLEKTVALLQGVTGSGKTLLYIHKIKEVVAAGKQAILLLPEIGLTTQLVSRLYAYFGEELGVYHSRFSNNERVEIWEKVRKEQYKIVVGPRSALWLPYKDVGLIIVDEEHDGSYKQKEPAPRFHARDAAIYLARIHNSRVILGSATPSVESLYNAHQGKYAFVKLEERYLGVKMPEISIIDGKSADAGRKQGIQLLTPELQRAIAQALENQRQVILFQNRRGYAPFQLCMVCGWVPQCKNCAVSLTYHKITDKLHCHYCGLRQSVMHNCAACGSSRMRSKSFGTERVEEEVLLLFPKARVARMDVDSMRGKSSFSKLLEQLDKRQIDILVGTQMVVKGLDFAPVSLVGIISADSLLSFPDFRVNERAFQLMEQVSGRAGRADGAGKVLIQSYNTKHPILGWVQQHDIASFYQNEIQYRERFLYPPFTRLIKIIFKHRDEVVAVEGAGLMVEALKDVQNIAVQGPVPALVARVRNMYVQEVWIKCNRDMRVIDTVKNTVTQQKQIISGKKGFSGLQILPDVDPV